MGAKCSKKAEPPSAAYEQRYDQELQRLQAERKAKRWAKYCCPCCCNCCCSSCDKRNATKVAIEQTETAARAKEALQKSLGKKRLSAVAAFTKNPTFNSRGSLDEAALEEQRRLEAKNKFISHGRKGKVTNGLHVEFSADFKPHVSVGRAHVSTRSVSEDGRRDCWRFLEPGMACLRVEVVLTPCTGLELRIEESCSPDAFDWTQCGVDIVFDGTKLCLQRRPASNKMTWWTTKLENVTGQAQTLQITLCEDSAPWNYLLQSIVIALPDKPKPILPSKADIEETLATYMNAPNPAPTDIESILDGVPKPQVVEPVGVEEKRIAAKKQKEEERKRKKAKLAAMKRKEKQASGELPPPSAEELEKERKLQEAQLAMARERAHAHALKEYKDEYERELEARKKRADEELAKTPHMVELAAMRKKYGSIDAAVARIEAGQSPVDPLFRETRAQRKAREDAEKERKKNLPDPFREFVEEGDPYYEYLAREEKYRQQGKRPGDVLD